MAIQNITIKNASQQILGVISATQGNSLSGRIAVGPSRTDVATESILMYKGDSFSTHNQSVKLSDGFTDNIYEKAYDQFVKSDKAAKLKAAVKTINGVGPTEDGAFFIHGSACTDVYTTGSIEVIDHCTPCFECENVYKLKRLFEYYRILINAIKDINLYDVSTTTTRAEYLESERITIPASCKDTLEKLDALRLTDPISLADYQLVIGNLLRQYVTTVHLWNYAVSLNNSSSKIQNTPEDPSGILIQTKRGIASCSNNPATIKCEVNLSLSGDARYLYLPQPKTEFTPKSFGSISDSLATVEVVSDLSRKIVTQLTSINSPGTVTVTIKALPFKAYKAVWEGDDEVVTPGSEVDWTAGGPEQIIKDCAAVKAALEAEGKKATGEFEHSSGARLVFKDKTLSGDPTLEDYHNSKIFPSQSSRGVMTWTIDITWTVIQNGVTQTINENYEFEVPGLRTVVNGYTRVSQFSGIGDMETPE